MPENTHNTSRRINLSGVHPQTRSKSKQPGEDTAEFSKQHRKKVDFLTEETSKGKVLAFPTLPSHSSFQSGLGFGGEPEGMAASRHWRALWNPETRRDLICWAFLPETRSQLALADHLEIHPRKGSDDKWVLEMGSGRGRAEGRGQKRTKRL